MKKLSKLKLTNAILIEEDEMKNIFGGYRITGGYKNTGSDFRCSCDSAGSNPPFKTSWMTFYLTTQEMTNDILRICKRSGSCSAIN